MSLSNLEEVVLVAADRLKPRGAAVSFEALFKSLPQSRGVIKNALLSLEEKGVIAFHRHNHPAAASREARKAMIHRGKDFYHAFAIRKVENAMKRTVKKKNTNKPTPAQLKARAKFAAAAKARSKKARARNKTIIKAKRVKIAVTNPKRRARRNPYAYQILYKSGAGEFKSLGGIPANSRGEALKKAESELKRKGLWKSGTKLITGAVPLSSTAARHKNASKKKPAAKKTRRRNAEHRDAQHPIHVRQYWQGRKGYKTPWQRAHEAGQGQLFSVKNSGSKVRAIREKFSGRPSTKTATMIAPNGTPANLAKLGKLVLIKAQKALIKPTSKNPGSIVWLCADAKGKLHLCTTGADLYNGPAQDFGEVSQIEYQAIKPHLGHPSPTIFFHKMGEEGGKRPHLVSDGQGGLKFKGGDYTIGAEGIRD